MTIILNPNAIKKKRELSDYTDNSRNKCWILLQTIFYFATVNFLVI